MAAPRRLDAGQEAIESCADADAARHQRQLQLGAECFHGHVEGQVRAAAWAFGGWQAVCLAGIGFAALNLAAHGVMLRSRAVPVAA